MPKVKNPQVFMDISIDRAKAERITFELFANVVPKTAENFRALCTGEKGVGASTKKPLYFKGTNFHRIIPGFVAQGGDFSKGDGRGGESIYGGKFPDENFKLKHDKPGILSMANSGAHTNGSQFFITFMATPHLDGKHVVFGKVISGLDLLKKLEAVGSESGVPSCQVKIVDCGEVSTQDKLQGEKEKKLKKADVTSDDERRAQSKKASRDTKRSKKRKHYSSDSYSSDASDSQSYSSDSVSESESYSSSSIDTSSSSDHRRKRRKGSKKDKRKSTKRKGKHTKSKKKISRGSKRKSRRTYGSSSEDTKSSKTDSSSSETESAGHRTKRSLPKAAGQENTRASISEQLRAFKDVDELKAIGTVGNKTDDENEADDRTDPGARISPIQVDENLTKRGKTDVSTGNDTAGVGTGKDPSSNEPVARNGRDSALGSADNGQPQRIRKGRGFTKEYAFARRYKTPSPERPPVRSRYDGGRNDRWNNFNRYGRNGPYGRRSPVRRYRGSPRASSPSRYRYSRRDRSRSRSRSPVRRYDRGGYRRPSPRRSRSPAEQRREDVSNRPHSGRDAGGSNDRSSSPPANRGRSRSRSKSRDPSRSRSPDPAPAKRGSSKYNRRRSSSSRSSSPEDGNKGLVSY